MTPSKHGRVDVSLGTYQEAVTTMAKISLYHRMYGEGHSRNSYGSIEMHWCGQMLFIIERLEYFGLLPTPLLLPRLTPAYIFADSTSVIMWMIYECASSTHGVPASFRYSPLSRNIRR